MQMHKIVSAAVAASMALSALPASAAMMQDDSMMSGNVKTGVMVGGSMMVPNKNIVENAMNAKNVTTVVAAVKAAGLVDTLMGEGPFTVFAPKNDAFKRLPDGTVDMLLETKNKDMLTSILTYHVVAGRYTSKDLKDGMMLTTVNGQKLAVKRKGRNVWVGGARVSIRDVISSNGVTHVINRVLMPK